MEDNIYELGALANFSRETTVAENMPAIVSIEIQRFGETYDVQDGFPCGTVFPALYKPFLAGGIS